MDNGMLGQSGQKNQKVFGQGKELAQSRENAVAVLFKGEQRK